MESEVLFSVVSLVLAVLAPAGMALFSIKKPPSWLDKGPLAPFWTKINFWSAASAIVAGFLTFLINRNVEFYWSSFSVLSVSIMTFILGQTLFTDFTQRLADRRVMRIANLFALSMGLWALISFNSAAIPVYLIFILAASAILFAPNVGDSDGRAAQLIVLAGFPLIGGTGFIVGMLSFSLIVVGYSFIMAIKNKKLSGFLTAKTSVPLVPLLLIPFTGVTMLFSFIASS